MGKSISSQICELTAQIHSAVPGPSFIFPNPSSHCLSRSSSFISLSSHRFHREKKDKGETVCEEYFYSREKRRGEDVAGKEATSTNEKNNKHD